MNATKEKIIKTAIHLFNLQGVGNVRIQDIAETASISPGNLTYHFKTKKELMKAIYHYMMEQLKERMSSDFVLMEAIDTVKLSRDFLKFQIEFRFFYRDTLEILNFYPEVKTEYQEQIKIDLNFNYNVIILLAGKGYILPETYNGQFLALAKNSKAIFNSWLSQREILGEDATSIEEPISNNLDLFFPYMTEKGKDFFFKMKEDLPKMLEMEGVELK